MIIMYKYVWRYAHKIPVPESVEKIIEYMKE